MKVTLSNRDVMASLTAYVTENFGDAMGVVDVNFAVSRKDKSIEAEVEIAPVAQVEGLRKEREAEKAAAAEATVAAPEGAKRGRKPKAEVTETVAPGATNEAVVVAPASSGGLFS